VVVVGAGPAVPRMNVFGPKPALGCIVLGGDWIPSDLGQSTKTPKKGMLVARGMVTPPCR
jgi:hypothetical protein